MGKSWRELQGQDDWKGLLNPVSVDLRTNLVRYGEMVQAVYDTFIAEEKSKWAGAPRFTRANMLDKVTLSLGQAGMYRVTKYFYATSSLPLPVGFFVTSLSREAWSKESNWIGYVAVATDEGKAALGRRDVLIVWRGTMRTLEWVNDFDFTMGTAPSIVGSQTALLHRGFLSVYNSNDPKSPFTGTSARDQVLKELARIMELYKGEEISITVTGHSLGASLATLNAIDIVSNGHNKAPGAASPALVTAFVFASPRVGDFQVQRRFSSLSSNGLRLLHIRNALDIVPNYPAVPYVDVGVQLPINTSMSPYVKQPGDIHSWHNLECYMHGIAGVVTSPVTGGNASGILGSVVGGIAGVAGGVAGVVGSVAGIVSGFEFAIDRDIALVNKDISALKDDYLVPDSWWVEKNKCMVKKKDGKWHLDDHEEDDNL